MTPYKITTLYKIHKFYNGDKFKVEPERLPEQDDIDIALGGL